MKQGQENKEKYIRHKNSRPLVIINGAVFATGRKDGVPRVCEEIMRAMDQLPQAANPEEEGGVQLEIVTPIPLDFSPEHIKVTVYRPEIFAKGKLGQERWRQLDLINYVNQKNALLADPGMLVPLRKHDLTFIHDCQPERMRASNYATGTYSKTEKIRLFQRKQAITKSRLLVTNSEYSKKDLLELFHIPEDKIRVIPLGWQHFLRVEEDDSILEKLPTGFQDFCFALGSRYKHKNTAWILAAAAQNPQLLFVISGYNDVAAYSEDMEKTNLPNVMFTGFIPDGQVKALMKHARAFIQPSFSEGFGLPPLEALSVGTEIVLSNASALPGIYGACAHYISPDRYDGIDMETILATPVEPADGLLEKYSWDNSAKAFMQAILDCLQA